MTTKRKEKDPVAAAARELNQQKNSRPEEYQSAWEQQLRDAMEQILNREGFQYDLNGDALYQQYRQQAVRNGRLAMMDTIGQASALTGGYANSYAQNAGQQAYQQELLSLNDRIPELYALALSQYRMRGQDLQDRYDLLAGREGQDYGRYQDRLAAWQKDRDQAWKAYTDQRDFAYGAQRDNTADQQWQAKFDEDKRRYDQEWADAHPVKSSSSQSGYGGSAAKKDTSALTKKKNTQQKAVLL